MRKFSKIIRNFLKENPCYYLFWVLATIALLLCTFLSVPLAKDGLKWREEHELDSTEESATEISEEIDCYDVRKLMDSIQDSDTNLDEIYDTLCDYKDMTDDEDVLYLICEAEDNISYERNYRKGLTLLNEDDFDNALKVFCLYPNYRKSLSEIAYILYYRESDEMKDVNKVINSNDPYVKIVYDHANDLFDTCDYENAKNLYYLIPGYKDSDEKQKICSDKIFIEGLD